jgi:hypothetical protein
MTADYSPGQRLEHANQMIQVIAAHGRRFFFSTHHQSHARVVLDSRGRFWWVDDYTGKRIYTHSAAVRLAFVSGLGALEPLLLTCLLLVAMAAAGAAAAPTPGLLAAIWAGITVTIATAYILGRRGRASHKQEGRSIQAPH